VTSKVQNSPLECCRISFFSAEKSRFSEGQFSRLKCGRMLL
jgi:hypothetical protein